MSTKKRISVFCVWLISLAMLISCNPYAGLATTPTPAIATAGHTPTYTATAAAALTAAPATCTVTTGVQAGNLNIRSGAGTSYAVIGILREGQALTITDEPARGAWINVTTSRNVTGWINQKFCIRRLSHD